MDRSRTPDSRSNRTLVAKGKGTTKTSKDGMVHHLSNTEEGDTRRLPPGFLNSSFAFKLHEIYIKKTNFVHETTVTNSKKN